MQIQKRVGSVCAADHGYVIDMILWKLLNEQIVVIQIHQVQGVVGNDVGKNESWIITRTLIFHFAVHVDVP